MGGADGGSGNGGGGDGGAGGEEALPNPALALALYAGLCLLCLEANKRLVAPPKPAPAAKKCCSGK